MTIEWRQLVWMKWRVLWPRLLVGLHRQPRQFWHILVVDVGRRAGDWHFFFFIFCVFIIVISFSFWVLCDIATKFEFFSRDFRKVETRLCIHGCEKMSPSDCLAHPYSNNTSIIFYAKYKSRRRGRYHRIMLLSRPILHVTSWRLCTDLWSVGMIRYNLTWNV